MCKEIGQIIGAQVDKAGMGFALFVFDFNGPAFTWISNAQRASMIEAIQEFIKRNPPDQTSADRN